MSKKALSLVLCIVLILLMITGCGKENKSGTNEGVTSKNNLLYQPTGNTPYINLDPSVENSNGVMILQNVYETLTYYNYETGEIEPYLAESWTSSEDGKTWTFKIREGVKFHDGTVLNADAVKKSIDRTINMKLGASFIWDSVESIEVVNDYEVRFNLSYANPIDLIASAAYASFIMSPNSIDKNSDWFNQGNDSGSGPYMIQKVVAGEEVVLQKFDEYWKGWKDNQYTNVIVKKVAESSARRQLLEKGDAQITVNLSTTDLKALSESKDVNVLKRPLYDTVVGCLNTEKYPLNNVEFRRAVSYAFPYDEVIDKVLEGQGVQSYGMIPSGLWGHSEELMQYDFDLDKAQEHLKKSGIDPNGIKLEMTITSGYDEYRSLAQLLQINLKKLGIDLEIREMSWDLQWEKGKNPNPEDRQDIFLFIWWPDYPSPISWFEGLVKSEEDIFFNLSYIKDKEIDEMIKEASIYTVTDRNRAEEIMIKMQEKVIDEAYFIHMYDKSTKYVIDADLKGFNTNPAYPTVVRYYDLYK